MSNLKGPTLPPDRPGTALTQADRRDLQAAVACLEHPTFAAQVATFAGRPVDAVIRYLPKAVNRRLRHAVRLAIYKCLQIAIDSLDTEAGQRPSEWTGKVIAGFTGGVGGFFGMAALPFELPLTTTLMLRAIAETARAEGEDLRSMEALLACLEVFALGGSGDKVDIDYYAVRTMLTKLTGEMATYVMERGALNASSPIVARLIGEIAGRFGLMVSERVAAGAVPVIGAVGGAAVNMIFMDHFQRIARGHFVIRRLERTYGATAIRSLYEQAAGKTPSGRRKPATCEAAVRHD
jgi:hypothetical protein